METNAEIRSMLENRYGGHVIRALELYGPDDLEAILGSFSKRLEKVDENGRLPSVDDVEEGMYDDIVKALKINWVRYVPKETMLTMQGKADISVCKGVSFTPDELAITWYANRAPGREMPVGQEEQKPLKEIIEEIAGKQSKANVCGCHIVIYKVSPDRKCYLYATAAWDGEQVITKCKNVVPMETIVLKHDYHCDNLTAVSLTSKKSEPAGKILTLDIWVEE